MKAGFTVFLLSPRNASNAIVHMLNKTGAKNLFISSDPATVDLANAAIRQLQNDSQESPIRTFPMPYFEDLFPVNADAVFEPFPRMMYDIDASGIILHSSG